MLLEGLGIISKKVKPALNSGYDPDLNIEIGCEMWATLRYQFFMGTSPGPTVEEFENDPIESMMFDIGSYAVHVSPLCGEGLRAAAQGRFSTNHLGCIH